MDWKGWASHSRHCMPLWPKQMETVVWLPRHMAAQQGAVFLLMQPARAGRLQVCADPSAVAEAWACNWLAREQPQCGEPRGMSLFTEVKLLLY